MIKKKTFPLNTKHTVHLLSCLLKLEQCGENVPLTVRELELGLSFMQIIIHWKPVVNVTCPVMPVIIATFLLGSAAPVELTLAGLEDWSISEWLGGYRLLQNRTIEPTKQYACLQ